MLRQVNIGGALNIMVSSVYYLYYVDLSEDTMMVFSLWSVFLYRQDINSSWEDSTSVGSVVGKYDNGNNMERKATAK